MNRDNHALAEKLQLLNGGQLAGPDQARILAEIRSLRRTLTKANPFRAVTLAEMKFEDKYE
jgi:hypothetical protein